MAACIETCKLQSTALAALRASMNQLMQPTSATRAWTLTVSRICAVLPKLPLCSAHWHHVRTGSKQMSQMSLLMCAELASGEWNTTPPGLEMSLTSSRSKQSPRVLLTPWQDYSRACVQRAQSTVGIALSIWSASQYQFLCDSTSHPSTESTELPY
jgi:hypothetical protein